MDTNAEAGEAAGPSKPQFAPLSAYEQNGKNVVFRRVQLVPKLQRVALCALVQLGDSAVMAHRRQCRSIG